MDEEKKYHILFGINGLEIEDAKQVVQSLGKHDVAVSEYGLRYNKMGVVQYLDNNSVDVLIVSQHLEDRSPYTEQDFEMIAERHEGICLIPVLQNESAGRGLVHGLFQLGIYNAVYDDDAEYPKLAELIHFGRKRKEAKIYYGIKEKEEISHADFDSSAAYIEDCSQEELEACALHVIHMVRPDEFRKILSMLSRERYIQLGQIHNEEIMPFFRAGIESEKEKPGKGTMRDWLGSTLKRPGIQELGVQLPKYLHKSLSYILGMAGYVLRAGRLQGEGKGPPAGRGHIIGTVSIFITGLKKGCGKSHFAALLANYLSKRGRTCIVTNDVSELEGRLVDDVITVEGLGSPAALSANYVIYDLGDFEELSGDEYRELERATKKVLMCFPDDKYMKKLASFAVSVDLSEEFYYVFDNATEQKMKEVDSIMSSYATGYLPLCDATGPDAQVRSLLEEIYR